MQWLSGKRSLILAFHGLLFLSTFPARGINFSWFWAKFDHHASYGKTYQQIKHETGHVQFRVLRDNATGQNSLQLSSSTPAPPTGWKRRQGSRESHLRIAASGSSPTNRQHLTSTATFPQKNMPVFCPCEKACVMLDLSVKSGHSWAAGITDLSDVARENRESNAANALLSAWGGHSFRNASNGSTRAAR
jgi:hypothetical protein